MSDALPMLMASVGGVADAFVRDQRLLTFLMGPVGSAKTTSCIRKSINIGLWQNRGPDGIRRARIGVIRDTYPQLKKTVLESWRTWFPKSMGDWSGDSPMTHKVYIETPGVGDLELEMMFAAIGESRVEDVMRGWEVTALWLNEGDLLAHQVFRMGLQRIGRYPPARLGGCAWRGIMVDLNAPDVDNWTYPLMVDKDMGLAPEEEAAIAEEFGPLFGIGFHRQPGGRSKNPPPENMHNLPPGYYAQMMIGQSPDFVRRFVDNEFGAVRNGMPVYPEYQDELHCAKERLRPVRGVPIDIGVDGGLTPAAMIGQQLPNGQKRVLDEYVIWIDQERQELQQVGPTAFGQGLRRFTDTEYPDNDVRFTWSDPATTAGEAAQGNDRSWRQLFEKAFGYPVRRSPVKGNAIDLRLDAVRKPMRTLVGDGEPGYLLSPSCKTNRRGKNNGYVFRRTAMASGDERYKNEPVKNQFSHGQDGEQYLFCGWASTRADFFGNTVGKPRRIVNESAYNMFGD